MQAGALLVSQPPTPTGEAVAGDKVKTISVRLGSQHGPVRKGKPASVNRRAQMLGTIKRTDPSNHLANSRRVVDI
jgi:hypothetical protein